MKKVLGFIFILLFGLPFISACVDINTASLEELDKLYGIGPVKAQAIIDTRPFDSVDDLINAYGIGEKTLENIKNQGLACVDGEVEEETEEIDVVEENFADEENTKEVKKDEDKEIKMINLTSQIIKRDGDKKKLNKSKYAIYGFAGFCVLLGILFMLKRKKYKNEFR